MSFTSDIDLGARLTEKARQCDALLDRIRELEVALKRIVLKDGRESIAVSKICDIARRALASSSEREAK